MGEFKTIKTQEELDLVIKDRIDRLTRKHNEEIEKLKAEIPNYEELKNHLNDSLAAEQKSKEMIESLNAEIEKMKSDHKATDLQLFKLNCMNDYGIPKTFENFIIGNSEEEIESKTKELSGLIEYHNGTKTAISPLADLESSNTDSPMLRMVRELQSQY